MVKVVQSIFTTTVLIAFLLGLFANSFIVLVNFIDWIKRQKISSVNRILTALAVSRIGLLCGILTNWWLSLFNPVPSGLEVRPISFVWMVINHLSTWLATCLSIFYLLKIASFSNLIFLYLKWRAERVILVVLFGSLILLGPEFVVVSMNEGMRMNMSLHERNMTLKTELNGLVILPYLAGFTLITFIPFTISLISLLLLIFSIWKHFKKMQLNGKRYQDLSTMAHIKALISVTSFFLLLAIYILCVILSVWKNNNQKNIQTIMLCQTIGIFFPSSHSLILIFVNQKLREIFLLVLQQLRDRIWLKGRKLST